MIWRASFSRAWAFFTPVMKIDWTVSFEASPEAPMVVEVAMTRSWVQEGWRSTGVRERWFHGAARHGAVPSRRYNGEGCGGSAMRWGLPAAALGIAAGLAGAAAAAPLESRYTKTSGAGCRMVE